MLHLALPQTRLFSGAPWWLVRDGLEDYPLCERTRCDVAIVGGGITGALVADRLTAHGKDVILLDRRLPGTGSTSVSTALLLYELDLELGQLIDRIGEPDAVLAYHKSADAVRAIASLSAGFDCGFEWHQSIYLASRRRDRARLQREVALRQRHQLDAEWLDADALAAEYGVPGHGAIRTAVAGAVDPLRLMRALLRRAQSRGAGVMPWTTAIRVERHDDTTLCLTTDRAPIIANRVVLAMGYEVPPGLLPGVTRLANTWALVTEPTRPSDRGPLRDRCIVWESARPYSYLRAVDGRVMIGGADRPFEDHVARDRELPRQIALLEAELARLIPACHALTSYGWGGTFASTRDGLPVIGEVPDHPGVFYALGYGGNGITFGAVAARILSDRCLDRSHDDAHLYRADR